MSELSMNDLRKGIEVIPYWVAPNSFRWWVSRYINLLLSRGALLKIELPDKSRNTAFSWFAVMSLIFKLALAHSVFTVVDE